MEVTLEALGIDKETVTDLVVEKLVDRLMLEKYADEDGREDSRESEFSRSLTGLVRSTINQKVAALAEANLLPRVTATVESLVLQETSKWGEKVGAPVSFTEYLVMRAENYIREEVDFQGKAKSEGGYNWSKNTTRISYLINNHLQYHIEQAVKTALQRANEAIVGGLETAVKIKLQEVAAQMQLTVKTK
jgi:hypothetical protein